MTLPIPIPPHPGRLEVAYDHPCEPPAVPDPGRRYRWLCPDCRRAWTWSPPLPSPIRPRERYANPPEVDPGRWVPGPWPERWDPVVEHHWGSRPCWCPHGQDHDLRPLDLVKAPS